MNQYDFLESSNFLNHCKDSFRGRRCKHLTCNTSICQARSNNSQEERLMTAASANDNDYIPGIDHTCLSSDPLEGYISKREYTR